MASQHNPNRVAGGLNATINNPNTSDEAKVSATERLQNMGSDFESNNKSSTKKNRTAEFGQDDGTDDDADFEEETENDGTSSLSTSGGGGEPNRVLGGYKATLKNPNVSDEAKSHAEQVLKDNNAI